MTRLAALGLALIAALGLTQAGPQPPVATLTPLVSVTAVRPGDPVRLALRVVLPDGVHAQSDKPRDPTLIPSTLWIDQSVVAVREVVFPPSTDFRVQGLPELLAVFERDVAIGIDVIIPKTTPAGRLTIPARFRYQACDANLCFMPQTLETGWTVTVSPAGGTPDPSVSHLFADIAFGKGYALDPKIPAPELRKPRATDAPPPSETERISNFDVLAVGGYMNAADFVTWMKDAEAGRVQKGVLEGRGPIAILAIVFLGGLALNLTPCVLPMIPINLAIIGAGAQTGRRHRGFALGATYGGAMAIAYGILGLIVILTAGAFGTINSSPWFNAGIAALFVVLALAMFDVITVDFSRLSSRIQFGSESRGTFLLAFSMGAVAALLAGACVAPVVIQVVLFASDLYARGNGIALALPFVLGLGMALPWPLAGAGIARLPRPGAWMVRVKQLIGVFILGTAVYYGYLAYGLFANRFVDPADVVASVDSQLKEGWHSSLNAGLDEAERDNKLVLIDFWATWCKNCLVMDRTTLADPTVKDALAGYVKIKFQAEDLEAEPAQSLMRRFRLVGLPGYVILRPR